MGVGPHKNILIDAGCQRGVNGIHTLDKAFFENNDPGLSGFDTPSDGIRIKSIIERDGQCAGPEYAKIDGQPFDTVRHEHHNAVAVSDAEGKKGLGKLI